MADTPKKILIVDDEQDVIIFLKTFFTENDYEVMTANDGEEAFKKMKQEKPDLITLDLMMPNETGTNFYRKLHKEKDYKDIPVIVISGLAGRHLAVKEPFAIFDKPVDKEELLVTVKKALGEE